MQMTTEARTWLDATVRRIIARHPLGDPERAGITYELMSHLHGAGEARATAAGHTEVTREDLEGALADAGGEDQLAAAFVQLLAKPLERVLFWSRLGAFVIDAFLIGIALAFVHSAIDFLVPDHRFLPPIDGNSMIARPTVTFDYSLWGIMPWGFHDTTMPLVAQALIAVASAIIVMSYFTWFEAHEGQSLGKRALGLRVMRTDGRPMTFREAFLRNLAKLSPPILVIDTLAMLVAFNKERQRVSDRVAGTIVVRA